MFFRRNDPPQPPHTQPLRFWDDAPLVTGGSGVAGGDGAAHFPGGEYKPPSRKWFWIKRGFAGFFLLSVVLLIWLAVTAPLSKSLQPIAPPRITLLAADGTPIARNGAIVDQPVDIDKLPPHVVNAFLAIEDRRFYSHWGIDPRGLARAAWSNATGSGMKQGGSTITQQLAKFTFLTPERSMTRKAREMLIAFWLEARLSKDEILERYLSNVYFGDNVYGLRAASMHYFYRQPEKLTLNQAAMLAGLVQAPSRLAPTKNPKLAAKRMRLVLNAMAAAGYMSKAKADAVKAPQIDARIKETLPSGTYFADWALPQARASTDSGYADVRMTTTLDARLQNVARRVIANAPLGKAQVALVAMRKNGEVVAMVGGQSYKDSPFNRAVQAKRQPGSTFKLFVYLAALRAGMTPDTLIDDTAITEGAYQPKNYGDRYRGAITLREAFAQSSNVASVKLYKQVGDAAVIRAARDLGVTSPLASDPSLALGSSGMTLMELTAAYAGVASNEWPVEPTAFKAEEPGWFDWLVGSHRSFSATIRDQLMDLLGATVNSGTGRAAKLSVAAYGKTGTSQENRDALFIGFAGDLVVGVWIGNDDNTPLNKGMSGGGLPARIWRDFMAQSVKGAAPVRKAPKPAPVVDPDGPVEKLDEPDIPDIIGPNGIQINDGNSQLKIDKNGVSASTEIPGGTLNADLKPDGKFDIRTKSDGANR